MKVIFLTDVRGQGRKFEEKEISNGYALNYLLPRNLAIAADKAGRAKIEQLKTSAEAERAKEESRIKEKEQKRSEKHQKLEEFRQKQKQSDLRQD